MTDTPPPGNSIQLNFQGGLTKQPNGQHWPMLTFAMGLTNFSFTLPSDTFRQMAEKLPEILNELAKQADDANIGLVLGPNALKQFDQIRKAQP